MRRKLGLGKFEEQVAYLRDAGYYSATFEQWRICLAVAGAVLATECLSPPADFDRGRCKLPSRTGERRNCKGESAACNAVRVWSKISVFQDYIHHSLLSAANAACWAVASFKASHSLPRISNSRNRRSLCLGRKIGGIGGCPLGVFRIPVADGVVWVESLIATITRS